MRLTNIHGNRVRESSQLHSARLIKFNVFPNVTIQERSELVIVKPLSAIEMQNFLHLRNRRC